MQKSLLWVPALVAVAVVSFCAGVIFSSRSAPAAAPQVQPFTMPGLSLASSSPLSNITGLVEAKSPTALVVHLFNGQVVTVSLTASTSVQQEPVKKTLNDVAAGSTVSLLGSYSASGVMTAKTILLLRTATSTPQSSAQ
jgi:hypothetical protein